LERVKESNPRIQLGRLLPAIAGGSKMERASQ